MANRTTPANGDERAQVLPLLDALKVRTGKRGRPRKRLGVLATDKGYDAKALRQKLRQRGIWAQIPKRVWKTKKHRGRPIKKGVPRFQAERTFTFLRADEVNIVNSDVGFMNRAAKPNYRVFLTKLEMHLTNFSNQLTEGTAAAKVTGHFMGSGRTVVGASFRPETNGPDFALAAAIEHTNMRALNPLLRAYGNFDVVQGFFSVYTEMRVQNRAVRGYVKPLLRELDVYDPGQDQEKGLFQKLYEGVVGGISELLENSPRDEVATVANISGRLENPQASTWPVLVHLIQNAFFDAILPGFRRELGRGSR